MSHTGHYKCRCSRGTAGSKLPVVPNSLLTQVIRDNNFCRCVASRFLLPSRSYCLTQDVTEIRSLPHNVVTKMRR